MPVFDSLRDALAHVVSAAGGFKSVAHSMRPALPLETATSWLRKALKHGERERLDIEDVQFLLRAGHACGCHVAVRHIARSAGYSEPVPIEPEDRRAELQRQFIESTRAMQDLLKQMEALK